MVVDDLDLRSLAAFKLETKPPLIVYADAPSLLSVAPELLKTVLRGNPQIIQAGGPMQHL